VLLHQLLLLGGARLSSRQGLLENRWGIRSNRGPFMKLLTEEVGLEAK